MKQKLIFLDIDGVMNNKNDKTSYFCLNPASYGISNENLNNLKYLISLTGAKIVLSTAWRNHEYDFSYRYNNMLFKSPLKDLENKIKEYKYFIDRCPHISGCNKYEDILGFFYNVDKMLKLKKDDFNFVVLDDARNQNLSSFNKRFFCIDINTGLTKTDAESIALFLNYEE